MIRSLPSSDAETPLLIITRLRDLLEPNEWGILSIKTYRKVECETLREMLLSYSDYRLPMAEGAADSTFTSDPEWDYAQPDSVREAELEAVCAH